MGHSEGDKEKGFSILLAFTVKDSKMPGQCILLHQN